MKWISNYLTVAGLVLAAILTAYGKPLEGVLAAVVTLVVRLWQHRAKLIAAKKQEGQTDTIARMMLKGGLGNFYSEEILRTIDESGRTPRASEGYVKALELDPTDECALMGLSIGQSLNISGRVAHGESVSIDRIRQVRRMCRKGRSLYPGNSAFPESLGALADAEGNHEIAQHWFRKAGTIARTDNPSWRISLSTSLAMQGDFQGSLNELEEATKAGFDFWTVNFYRGRALCLVGRYADALPFLRRALHQRGQHPDIAMWLHIAHVGQSHLIRAAYQQVASAVSLSLTEPRNALRLLPRTFAFPFVVCWNQVNRVIFFALAAVTSNRRLLYRVFQPDGVQATLSYGLSRAGHFKAAEDLCRKGLASLPDSIMLLSNLAMALAFQNRKEDALAELEKAILLDPDNKVLLHNREQIQTQKQIQIGATPARPGDF